ncbi:5-methyltetrahydropteroyltriglutamate--homocysteine methyltransferase [compost metagenome]
MGESNWGPQPSLSNFNTTYKFTQSSEIAPGEYSLLKTPIIGHPMWWNSGRDHTGENNGNGYMPLFNANSIPGTIFYEKKYSKLCTGSFCTFSIYASNIFTPTYNGYSVKPKIKIELVNPSDGRILQSIASDELEIGKTNELLWKEISISFTISEGMSDVLVRVINAQSDPNPFGNDLALDDASFSICVPEVTLSSSNEVRIGESTIISAINHNTTSIEYDYQWQQWDGNEWKDIPGATSLQYKTPILNQDTLYRIRYAQKGIDITNNNNLICSGSKEMNFQLPSPQYSACAVNTINADFEYPEILRWERNINQNYNPSQLGWKTTAPDGMIEFWKNGDMGLYAYSGNQFIELNANYSSGLYQDYDTSIATYFNYSFAHKGRLGYDTMVLKAGPPGGPYVTIATVTTGAAQWQLYKGTYTVPSSQTTTRFIFESLSTATNDPTVGNFLDTINFTATINPPSIDGNFNSTTGSFEKTICSNNSVNFNASGDPGSIIYWYDATGTVLLYEGITFTTPNLTQNTKYKVKQKNSFNCESDFLDIEVLVLPKPADIIKNIEICSGETYTWLANGITYSTSQTGLKITNDGCTADEILNLTVGSKPADVVTTESICPGDKFIWPVNGVEYSTAQNGLRIINNGCTADQVLNLTIKDELTITQLAFGTCIGEEFNNMTVCKLTSGKVTGIGTPVGLPSGLSLIWSASDNTIKLNGSPTELGDFWFSVPLITDDCGYRDPLGNVIALGNIGVNPKPEDIVTNETICSGETFHWDATGLDYNISGTYTKNNEGCTADQVLNLTITPKPADIIKTIEVCPGEVHPAVARDVNDGCTADIVYNFVYVPKSDDIVTTESICSGKTFHWDVTGMDYNTSGTYTQNNDGCMADQILNLTVTSKPADIVTTESICFGKTYTWPINGITYSTSQTGLKIVKDGCTADQVLNLTVSSKPADVVTTESICSGKTFHWNVTGMDYNTSGTYIKNNDGCTADQILNLTVTPKPADVVTNETICSGTAYSWSATGLDYNTSGTFTKNNDGCTADQILNLTVTPKPADIVTNETICFGEKYIWTANGLEYTASQNRLRIINDGCTADQVLNLTVKENILLTSFSTCINTYSGEIKYDLPASKATEIITSTGLPPGITVSFANNTIIFSGVANTVGEFHYWILLKESCDIVNGVITVLPKPKDIIENVTICEGEEYVWAANGNTYSTSQTGLKIVNNRCTADQILNLTVTPKPTTIVTDETICSGATYFWSATRLNYSTSGTYTKNNDGCTSDQVLNLTITPKPADVVTTESICSGTAYSWVATGLEYNTSGTYTKNNDGCTADQILNLTVTPKPADVVTNETICSGTAYSWSATGLNYNTTGTYTKNNDGCTADQVLNLTVGSKPADIVTTESICSGTAYSWAATGLDYNTSGTYIKNNDGCTADQILNLTVTPKPADIVTNETICSGATYSWSATGLDYNTSGTYTKNNDGCTADQVLELIVGTKPESITTKKEICFGESFTWEADGQTYTASGTYTQFNNGCTADQVLELTVNEQLNASLVSNSLSPELCNGENDGSFKIEITGGIKPYSVTLDHKNGTYTPITDNDYTFIELSGGRHTVYIKDALDCTTEIEVSIPNGITINPVANISYSCLDDLPVNSVTITLDSGITNLKDLDYSLDGVNYQSENTFTNVPAGKQSIKVRHTNGCIQSTRDFIIDYVDPLTLTIANVELNEIVATATGGNRQYRYSFNNEAFGTTNKFIFYKSGDYTVTVTDQNGCATTTSKYFEYIDVCIPNHFTPNGDGINDEWGPGCTTQYKNLTFTVFDRYGRIIGNYKYGQKWDGKYNGAELSSGDYWYVLKLNDNKDNREFVGHFTLYR